MTTRAAFLLDLIGKPYQLGARGPDAYDCWALVRHVERGLYGRDLPDISAESTDPRALAAIFRSHAERRRWVEVERPLDGAVVLMARLERPFHCGVYLEEAPSAGVLHAWHPRVVFERLDILTASGWGCLRYFVPAEERPVP